MNKTAWQDVGLHNSAHFATNLIVISPTRANIEAEMVPTREIFRVVPGGHI